MKILFCSPTPLDRKLGAPKVTIELAEGLRGLGCKCEFISPADVDLGMTMARHDPDRYAQALRVYLHKNAAHYDVADYDHEYLPFDRGEFPASTLMVARSVLLHYHFGEIPIPYPRTARAIASRMIRGVLNRPQRSRSRKRADRTAREADLFTTLNTRDGEALERRGISSSKIAVVGLGLHPERFTTLACDRTNLAEPPTIAFVGTFDYRKGCLDFPGIVARVIQAIPDARFRLIGTRGLFQSEEQVRSHFPESIRSRIEVYPQFAPEDLPALLRPCSAGMFPSYIEGFGFGVLEMLAAGLPVFGYDAPGPCDILPRRWLVPIGKKDALANGLIQLLGDTDLLKRESRSAQELAATFTWTRAAQRMLGAYHRAREMLLRGAPIRLDFETSSTRQISFAG